MWQRVVRAAAGVAVAAVLFTAGGWLMLGALERQLIYFPDRVPEDEPPRPIAEAAVEEVWLEADDGVRLHAVFAGRDDAIAELLFLHGNAGSLYDRLENVAALVRAGFSVLIVDYRGYGKSAGSPSEQGLYRDGLAAYRYLVRERRVDPSRLVVFGRSLGAAVAIELARREPMAALIMESPFTSVVDMARVHYGWLPDFVLGSLNHEFDSLAKAPQLGTPVLYVHGTEDRIVPLSMGRRLYEASPAPKRWYEIEGAGHNDTWYLGGPEYYARLMAFVRAHVSGAGLPGEQGGEG